MVYAWGFQRFQIAWNYPAWSVSAEWFAYLLFPFLAFVVIRITSRYASLVLALLALSAYFYLFTLGWGSALTRVTCEFLCGMFLFRLYDSHASARIWQWLAPAALVAMPILLWCTSTKLPGRLIVLDCALLVIGMAFSHGAVAKFLGSAKLVFLGEISYSLYLTHGIIMVLEKKILPMHHFANSDLVVRIGIAAFWIVVLFASAAGMYLIVERPARNWLRSRIRAPQLRQGV
jgi:peptidoglycan/LPS O-acetylase OafA/YrhL